MQGLIAGASVAISIFRVAKVDIVFTTSYGAFDGNSWEALCQQVFRRKYRAEEYQAIQASPGDFGLEGFTLKTGFGFQCYCPDKHYTRTELYQAQRDKITRDLGKLRIYEKDIRDLIGSTKIRRWAFVTPEVDKHALVAHARTKEQEVRTWNLSILDPDFTILLYDGETYLLEINEIRTAAGEALVLDDETPALTQAALPIETYEANVIRKNEARLAAVRASPRYQTRLSQLNRQTIESFLETDSFLRKVEKNAPATFVRLISLINEYEKYVVETSAAWTGTPEALTEKVRDGLEQKVFRSLSPAFDEANAARVARHMVARWLALCELDYD